MSKPRFLANFIAIVCCLISEAVAQPVTVNITTPRRGTIVTEKHSIGHLQPQSEIKVFANIAGKIVEHYVVAGEKVSKGAVLARSTARQAGIAVIQAEAALSAARSRLTTTEANAQARVESQLAIAQESRLATQAKLEETKLLAEMRVRNQLIQAESAYKSAAATLARSEVNARQAVERAKAELARAALDFERTRALHEKQHISDSDFEASETRFKLAQSRHREALATLNQFEDGTAQLAVDKARAELDVARKVVESRGWEREIAAAESKVTQAEANLSTAQKLVEAKSWEHEIAIARTAVREAEEQLKLAQEQVNNAAITSPIDGVIAMRHLNVGDYARPAAVPGAVPVFTVVSLETIKAVWHMPAADVRSVEIGDMVLMSTVGIQNIVCTVDFISPTVNREDDTVHVHAAVQNSVGAPSRSRFLIPGASITVSVKIGERKNVLLLPRRAVLRIQNGAGEIFVVEGNVARRQQVSVGAVYGGEIEITSRLALKTQVIVDVQHRLADGTAVAIASD